MTEERDEHGAGAADGQSKKQPSEGWNPITLFTAVLALSTIVLAVVSYLQYTALQSTDNTVSRQLKVVEANERPWVKVSSVEALRSQHPGVLDGLSFSRDTKTGVIQTGFLPLRFALQNVGKAPAFDVKIGAGQYFGRVTKDFDLGALERQLCRGPIYQEGPLLIDNAGGYARSLFPGDTFNDDSVGLRVDPQQVAKEAGGPKGEEDFPIWLLGCVSYALAGTDERRHTSFAYRLGHTVEGQEGLSVTFRNGDNVAADRIVLEPRPFAADTTD